MHLRKPGIDPHSTWHGLTRTNQRLPAPKPPQYHGAQCSSDSSDKGLQSRQINASASSCPSVQQFYRRMLQSWRTRFLGQASRKLCTWIPTIELTLWIDTGLVITEIFLCGSQVSNAQVTNGDFLSPSLSFSLSHTHTHTRAHARDQKKKKKKGGGGGGGTQMKFVYFLHSHSHSCSTDKLNKLDK